MASSWSPPCDASAATDTNLAGRELTAAVRRCQAGRASPASSLVAGVLPGLLLTSPSPEQAPSRRSRDLSPEHLGKRAYYSATADPDLENPNHLG